MKSLAKRSFPFLVTVMFPGFWKHRRARFVSLGVIALILIVVAAVSLQRPGGKPRLANAADSLGADSTRAENSDKGKGKKRGKNEKKPEPPVPVEISVAAPRDIPATFTATGSLEAKRQVKLIAKSGGQIVKLAVEEGDFVKQGAVLLEIEHRAEELKLEQNKVRSETAARELT
ncbi:MAG TPA: biotin/lipoyl-binding protein, partial [Candidatus Eisenbacteria bacterium]|nr:biotin/lipoyl-binding protein [Candidatus Eisenbacteria bacterium]